MTGYGVFKQQAKDGHWMYKDGFLYRIKTDRIVYDEPKLVKGSLSNYGYRQLIIQKNNKKYLLLVHRLIWIVCNGDIDPSLSINHMNGIKTDNRIENLELISRSDNTKHAHQNGLITPREGYTHPRRKLNDDQVSAIRVLYDNGFGYKKIHNLFPEVSIAGVKQIIKRITYKDVN